MTRGVTALLLWLAALWPAAAQNGGPTAQWPERQMRFIVPFPAGATTDVAARIIQHRLGERLGHTLVIENRAGASGNLGSDAIAKAAPDGYTMGMATSTTHPIAVSLSSRLPYDPVKDFTHVSMLATSPYALVAFKDLPVQSVGELIAYARANPGKVAYSSVGPASLAHLAAQLFATTTGIELTHVPYRSASQAVIDLVAGRIQIQFGLVAASLSTVRDGQLTALAVTSSQRVPDMAGVPTIAESGVPGFEATLWMALVMPAGVRPAIVARLNEAVVGVLGETDIAKALHAQGMIIEPSTPEALRERIRSDMQRWRDLAVKARLAVQ